MSELFLCQQRNALSKTLRALRSKFWGKGKNTLVEAACGKRILQEASQGLRKYLPFCQCLKNHSSFRKAPSRLQLPKKNYVGEDYDPTEPISKKFYQFW